MLDIIIPTHNEERRLDASLQTVVDFAYRNRSLVSKIIVVDDGSQDGTLAIIRKWSHIDPRIVPIHIEENRGKGYAVKAGMLASNSPIAIFTDADLPTPLEEATRLLSQFPDSDVVIASRYKDGRSTAQHSSLIRKITSRIWNVLRKKILLPSINDSQCGFKIFKRNAIDAIFPLQTIDGFTFDVEILLIAQRQGLTIREAGVIWKNSKDSNLRLLPTSLKMLHEIIKIKLQDLRGIYGHRRTPPTQSQ